MAFVDGFILTVNGRGTGGGEAFVFVMIIK